MNRIFRALTYRDDRWDYAIDLILILATIGAGFIAFAALIGTAHIAHLLQGGK